LEEKHVFGEHGSGLTPRFFLNLSEVVILKKMNDI
jgi:hypothetical protein